MQTLEALLTRYSSSKLTTPAPNKEQLNIAFKAALRAPDHARLRPTRFITVEGEAREALGQCFRAAAEKEQTNLDASQLARSETLALRAPLVVIATTQVSEHPKVPEIEQVLSTGAAVSNLLLALYDQGFGAIWRTGVYAFSPHVKQALGLEAKDHIVGYIYIGTPEASSKSIPELNVDEFVRAWPAE